MKIEKHIDTSKMNSLCKLHINTDFKIIINYKIF